MSKDYLLDIINDLDEDLILDTAQERSRIHRRKWIYPATVAAVFALVVSTFVYAGGLDLFAQNSESNINIEEKDVHYSIQETERHESHSMESLQESPSVIITLDQWTDDGFIGTVSEIVDTEVIPVGSKVSVKTDENTVFLKVSEDFLDMESTMVVTDSCKSDLVTFCVMFRAFEGEDFSCNTDDSEKVYYLYAEQVWPTETIQEWGSEQ